MSTVIPFPARRRPVARLDVRAVLEAALEKTLDAVDHLVAELDAMDDDPDLEPGGDEEPSLGAPAGGASQAPWAAGGDQDLELDPRHLPQPARPLHLALIPSQETRP